jgi:hypothetical protein
VRHAIFKRRTYFFFKNNRTAMIRKITKQIVAISAAVSASDPKPRNAAISAMTMKTMAWCFHGVRLVGLGVIAT